jgi:hypothetical protein
MANSVEFDRAKTPEFEGVGIYGHPKLLALLKKMQEVKPSCYVIEKVGCVERVYKVTPK